MKRDIDLMRALLLVMEAKGERFVSVEKLSGALGSHEEKSPTLGFFV